MALTDIFEDTLAGGLGTGLAVGLGMAVLAPLLRPVTRGGFYVLDAARAGLGHLSEFAADAVAEARHEAQPASGAGARADPAPDVIRP